MISGTAADKTSLSGQRDRQNSCTGDEQNERAGNPVEEDSIEQHSERSDGTGDALHQPEYASTILLLGGLLQIYLDRNIDDHNHDTDKQEQRQEEKEGGLRSEMQQQRNRQ